MFVKFFGEKYLAAMDKYIMVIPACLHCVHAGKVPHEKLKVNEPWGQMCVNHQALNQALNRGYLNPHCHIQSLGQRSKSLGSLVPEVYGMWNLATN